MKIAVCLLIGYLLGSLNPAALLGKLKGVNLRKAGTHNLGASNTMLVLGKGYGLLVMVLDIVKAFLAAKLAKLLFPRLAVAAMLAGLGAVIGHIFPFYMNFRGGKGLAAYGGMVMAFRPWMLPFFIVTGLVLMIIFNASVAMPMYAAVLFPILVWFYTKDLTMVLIVTAASVLIIAKHWSNIGKARRGEDLDIRKFIAGLFKKEK